AGEPSETGLDEPVQRYLLSQPDVVKYINQLISLLDTWLPQLERNNRSYVTVAIGCTGGQHRSVYFAEQLCKHYSASYKTLVHHRDMKRFKNR
ncbi:MAG: RNase adaptor protein RapZ, partial [Methanomicrobia archaeon]|nr:RNase adaptor protein RapZ [Methanomicrobia archaeon]